MRTKLPLAALLVLSACAAPSLRTGAEPTPQTYASTDVPECPADAGVMDGWDDRAPPRNVFGNTWYVGTCGITALLVTSPEGHLLLDGATEPAGAAIIANIQALGFEPSDVKFIVNSHEHSDHAGGFAHLQAVTGAPVLARLPAIASLQRGASNRADPQFDVLKGFPAVTNVQTLADDEVVRISGLALTVHPTPGHAPGGTSWSWVSCEESRCMDMVYADSLSAASGGIYRFSDHADYLAAFRRGIETVTSLPCDILVSPHPLASNLFARLDGQAPLMDSSACARYAADAEANLEKRLQREKGDIGA